MDVQFTEVDGHVVVKGSNRDSVEAAVLQMTQQGHQQMETTRQLGNNWIATVRLYKTPEETGWCEVTSIGLQVVVEASAETVLQRKIEELTTFGAILIAGPECLQGKWIAVLDRKAAAQSR